MAAARAAALPARGPDDHDLAVPSTPHVQHVLTLLSMILLVLSVLLINCFQMAAQLWAMHADPDYVEFPAGFAAQHDWWVLGDNWESTVIFTALFVPFVAAACIYSLGSAFRRPALANPWLVLVAAALFAVASLLARRSRTRQSCASPPRRGRSDRWRTCSRRAA